VEEVMSILPSLTAPTVANLHNSDWVSVEIVVDEGRVRDLIPELQGKGATGIIEYSLNKVI
jgi:ATP phosphoribosyltransferase